ncbi:MAG: flavodoxin domain-containing protein [Tepidanaerobacteraceae bacterium]|jgi:flavodoxin|nr:flavodoxin [Thermoanaerobacterales bacterium]
MKVLVVYQSKYGSTKQYAEWIQKSFKADLIDLNQNTPDYNDYSIIIFGGYLYAGSIKIAKHLIKNWEKIREKEVILFTTGAMPIDHPLVKDAYEKNLPQEIREKIKYFPLSGRIIHEKLSPIDKILIFGGAILEKDPEMKKGMKTDYDGVKQENLTPLYEYIEAIN